MSEKLKDPETEQDDSSLSQTPAPENMLAPMEFDLKRREVPVTIGGDKYILREALDSSVIAYRNQLMNCTQFTAEGKVASVKGAAALRSLLVSLNLFEEKSGLLVTQDAVKGLPQRIVDGLFKRLKTISDMDDDEAEALKAKNAQSDTTPGSE